MIRKRRLPAAWMFWTSILGLLGLAGCGGSDPWSASRPVTVPGTEMNLARFARVTATGTRQTFFGLWPRETDDAAYTVRDADPETGWKPPLLGESRLVLDFSPLLPAPFELSSLNGRWNPGPAGPVEVTVLACCGGEETARLPWADPLSPLVLDPPVEAGCVEIALSNPRSASLTELEIHSTPGSAPPRIGNVAGSRVEPDGFLLTWGPLSAGTVCVEIHCARSGSEPLTRLTLVDTVPGSLRAWQGPLPAGEGRQAVLVPVGPDGARGRSVALPVPRRAPLPFPESGVVEGFYGRPWSHAERRSMILRLARLGMGMYVYAPKNDPLHRDDWRTPYPDEALARFAELDRLARGVGVTFSFGISPGRDMDLDDPAERAVLLAKLSPLVDLGGRHFTLLFDDIEFDLAVPVDRALAGRHAALANELREALSRRAGEPVRLWFVPTVYSTERQERWPGGAEYVDALGALDPGISVLWTGTDTLSPFLEASDLADVTGRVGRKVVIWENEHATDGGDGFFGKIYLAPYGQRSEDLPGAVNGIVANPMIPGAADRLVLGTYAAFLSDPGGYAPEQARQRSIELETPDPQDRDLTLWTAETFHGSGVLGFPGTNLPRNPAMYAAIDGFGAALRTLDLARILERAAPLLRVAACMAAAQGRLHHSSLDPSLVDDLWVPADRLTHEGTALLWLLRMTGERLSGLPGEEALAEADRWFIRARSDRYALSLFKAGVFRNVLDRARFEDLGFRAPEIRAPDSDPRTGVPWRYRPCAEGSVGVYGLPGSSVDDGWISWTPGHPGVYEAVVTVSGDQGWTWERLCLVVKGTRGALE
jgi:hypothetical protein